MAKDILLLLNPPGKEKYLRDYYCSKTTKGNFIIPPVDLQNQSGILNQKYEIKVIDAIVENISPAGCLEKIYQLNPNLILSLTGIVSWQEDFDFFKIIKEKIKTKIFLSGDFLLVDGEKIIEKYPFIDGILLDFFSDSLLLYLENSDQPIVNLIYRNNDKIITSKKQKAIGEIEIPIPCYELFPIKLYRYPFIHQFPFITVVTQFGCPFRCTFCNLSFLGSKVKKVDNVLNELKHITQNLGIKEIYFGDPTFTFNKKYTLELCEKIINNKFEITWSCYTRVDLIDIELLSIMKKSGCHTIIFGVESGNDETLKKYNKGFTTTQIKEGFTLAKKMGIRTVGTFIIGLPGEDESACLKTIEFAQKLDCDYASFNTPIPRKGTPLEEEAVKNNWINPEITRMNQSGTYAIIETPLLSREKLHQLRNLAEIKFYMRFSYLIKRLFGIRSLLELKINLTEGMIFIKNKRTEWTKLFR